MAQEDKVLLAKVQIEELKKQYIYEKSLFERFGSLSVITFEEWLEIKNKQVCQNKD